VQSQCPKVKKKPKNKKTIRDSPAGQQCHLPAHFPALINKETGTNFPTRPLPTNTDSSLSHYLSLTPLSPTEQLKNGEQDKHSWC